MVRLSVYGPTVYMVRLNDSTFAPSPEDVVINRIII